VAEAPRAEIIVRDFTIEDLQDYATLREVQRALWHAGEARGAAVMVGAGFSRHAELPGATSPQPPLWDDFSKEMCRRLRYPHHDGPRDPLRLAEEFRAALGQAALDALIRDLVRDEALAPSDLHRDLLRLPWSDVLTTNWDTLLERARFADFDRTYEVVRTPADIASTRTPRIVKLHGSLPSHTPFIFAEEDYRTYPKRFAPFVNLAQQILLENELFFDRLFWRRSQFFSLVRVGTGPFGPVCAPDPLGGSAQSSSATQTILGKSQRDGGRPCPSRQTH
jgi:SIR2-like domain